MILKLTIQYLGSSKNAFQTVLVGNLDKSQIFLPIFTLGSNSTYEACT
jgi:hypothetical protein